MYDINDAREFDEIYEALDYSAASRLFRKGEHIIRREHLSDYDYRATIDFSLRCAEIEWDQPTDSNLVRLLVWAEGDGDRE